MSDKSLLTNVDFAYTACKIDQDLSTMLRIYTLHTPSMSMGRSRDSLLASMHAIPSLVQISESFEVLILYPLAICYNSKYSFVFRS